MLPSRNCKHCKTPANGRPLHDHCIAPWYEANREKLRAKAIKADRLAQKVEKAQDRAKREKLKRIPELIAVAQTAFNAFIRERDKDKGCFVCLRPFDQSIPGRALHAGHVRTRGAAGHLRFVEDNCMGECEGCNGPHGAKPHQIKAGAIARIGAERFAELENDNEPHKWTREELRQIAALYRSKLRELKAAQE